MLSSFIGITPILLDRKGKARYQDVIWISSLAGLIVGEEEIRGKG